MTDHLDRAAEALAITQKFTQMIDCGSIGDEKRIARWLVEAFDAAGLLVTPERDAAVAAKAWDEGFKQGGPMHDVNYDDPDAHTRNPYDRADRIEREAGESDA